MRDVLPKKQVGLYLYGSLTAGHFGLECSDIDLLPVISSELSDDEVEAFARENPAWDGWTSITYRLRR